MAKNTNINWRKKMIYQVFPRQHSKTRDFNGVISDMPRIKKLGTDIIYLLPIHRLFLFQYSRGRITKHCLWC